MNLEFEKGQTVKMVSHDNMVVEGAIGVIEGTRVVTSMVSEYTKRGKTGFILKTDYRTCLPYFVKWDDGSTSWVIGCTITPEDSIIEESIGDEIVLTLENGFFREVTFYERN